MKNLFNFTAMFAVGVFAGVVALGISDYMSAQRTKEFVKSYRTNPQEGGTQGND